MKFQLGAPTYPFSLLFDIVNTGTRSQKTVDTRPTRSTHRQTSALLAATQKHALRLTRLGRAAERVGTRSHETTCDARQSITAHRRRDFLSSVSQCNGARFRLQCIATARRFAGGWSVRPALLAMSTHPSRAPIPFRARQTAKPEKSPARLSRAQTTGILVLGVTMQ